jgi:hypothetical protein
MRQTGDGFHRKATRRGWNPVSGRGSQIKETQTMKCAVVFTLLLLLGCLPAAAGDLRLTAEIPFPFVAAGKTMPAGEYEISEHNGNPYAIWLREVHTLQNVVCLVNKDTLAKYNENKLVFNRYGDQTFLRTVVGNGAASNVFRSKAERVLIAAGTGKATETVMAYLK